MGRIPPPPLPYREMKLFRMGMCLRGADEVHIRIMLEDPAGWIEAENEVERECRVPAWGRADRNKMGPPPGPPKLGTRSRGPS